MGSCPSTDLLTMLEKVSGKMGGLLAIQRLSGVALRYESQEFIMYIHRYEAHKYGAGDAPYLWSSGQMSPEFRSKGTGGSKERTKNCKGSLKLD